MVVPWAGFSLSTLLAAVSPLGSANFVAFESLHDPARMPGQRERLLAWPYTEGFASTRPCTRSRSLRRGSMAASCRRRMEHRFESSSRGSTASKASNQSYESRSSSRCRRRLGIASRPESMGAEVEGPAPARICHRGRGRPSLLAPREGRSRQANRLRRHPGRTLRGAPSRVLRRAATASKGEAPRLAGEGPLPILDGRVTCGSNRRGDP